jgi:predicted nucleic acid-binding protein
MNRLIMDTGPLVAWFCPKDQHHAWAAKTFDSLPAGALVCEAVLAEACHLVAKDGVAPGKVLEFVERGGLALVPLTGEIPAIRKLVESYRDAGMDFTDGCVVRLSQLHERAQVCTTDSDFKVYRRTGRSPISLLAPFS